MTDPEQSVSEPDGLAHRVGPDRVQSPILRVELRALASNQLPAVLADIADDAGNSRGATEARWMATAAKDRAVSLSRIVALSVVPRAGETLWVDPYSEELRIESVTWHIDPDTDDDPHVTLQLSDIDFDVLGDDEDALTYFLDAGWTQDP